MIKKNKLQVDGWEITAEMEKEGVFIWFKKGVKSKTLFLPFKLIKERSRVA